MSTLRKYLAYYMYGPVFFESSILHHAYQFILPFVTEKQKDEVIRSIVFRFALYSYLI